MAAAIDIGVLIESLPGVYGGQARLARSGLPIIQLVAEYCSGMRIAEFVDAYPSIDEESLYAGIAYYLANREALDLALAERNREGAEALREWRAGEPQASA